MFEKLKDFFKSKSDEVNEIYDEEIIEDPYYHIGAINTNQDHIDRD